MRILFLITLLWVMSFEVASQDGYQLPPQEIIDLVDAPATPSISISPLNNAIAFIENRGLPALEDLAREELRLAGLRIDPLTHGPSRASYGTGISLTDINGRQQRAVTGLPENPRIRNLRWSPDARHLAFTHTGESAIELWVVDVAEAVARRISTLAVNDIMGSPYSWDGNHIYYTAVPEDFSQVAERPRVATSPVIQESLGRRSAVRTFQDLLRNQYDEILFEHYATSQLVRVDMMGNATLVGQPAIIWYFSISPDSRYILLNSINRPFSYVVPFSRFPQTIQVLDASGKQVYLVADVPMSDNLPQGFNAVREGRRSVQWRNDTPTTLFWVEALDGGDPARETEFRDQVYFLAAPFTAQASESVRTKLRYGGIEWGSNNFALITETWHRTRQAITSSFNPSLAVDQKKTVFDISYEDRYNFPGNFQTTTLPNGQQVLLSDSRGRKLYLFGQGASEEGNRPFIDEYDIATGNRKRLWRSQAPFYEYAVKIIDVNRGLVITRRESVEMHPNFYLRDIRRNRITQITDLPDPSAGLRELQSELIHYQRADGIPLSGMLYLPAGYNKNDGPLPTLLWAYPQEFKSADAAGQVSGSPYIYTRVGATSPVMLATQGYAVLNNASFPIVGEADHEPNDTFVDQLVANALAAIDKLVEMGVTDRNRVAVSGHSYGAFMTVNLLAHSDLFAAGIARSGAYNRSLTPFGFQGEERTFWDVPQLYMDMSPFTFAQKIKTPLLLIHGQDDNNAGTFPLQSERMYDALRGQGATVRLVMLPHEGHGYSARESALHMHWEWLQWLDRYVKRIED
jgi:dipeptidyl aminopeptidase/acylaminoacyl peptidase